MIKVIIIEDKGLEAAGIKASISDKNFKIIGKFENSQSFFANYQNFKNIVDVILIDFDLTRTNSELNGNEIIQRLETENYAAKCAIITNYDYIEYLILAKRAGAYGFASKDMKLENYPEFIEKIYHSDTFVIEEYTAKKILNEIIEEKDKNSPENYGLTNKHISLVKSLFLKYKTWEIIKNTFAEEFTYIVKKYSKKHGEDNAVFPDSFKADIQYLQEYNKNKKKINENILNDISQRLEIILLKNNIIEKYEAISNLPLSNKIFNMKNNRLKRLNKLADNFLRKYKNEIKKALDLPSIHRDVLIGGIIASGLINKQELFSLFKTVGKT